MPRCQLVCAIAIVAALSGCTPEPGVPDPGTDGPPTVSILVRIDQSDSTLVEGEQLQLTATVTTVGTTNDTLTWTSGNADAASVTADGIVTALSRGSAAIRASSDADPTRSDSITVTVIRSGDLNWATQFGTINDDSAHGVTVDTSGNVYVGGSTAGDLGGGMAAWLDGFVRAYERSGAPRWTRQIGTDSIDAVAGVATDPSGHVYVAGRTLGDLAGENAGGFDGFVTSHTSEGASRWVDQFGSTNGDEVHAIATDASGTVYVAGNAGGDLDTGLAGTLSAFVRAYTSSGVVLWTRYLDTTGLTSSIAFGIASDTAGTVYVSGYVLGDLAGASSDLSDAFVRAYDSEGNVLWTRQFGTSGADQATAVAADAFGNVFVVGSTEGDLDGISSGGSDAFVRAYDGDGGARWARQFGTSGVDVAYAVAADAFGSVYVVGSTWGDLDGTHAGARDVFVRSYVR